MTLNIWMMVSEVSLLLLSITLAVCEPYNAATTLVPDPPPGLQILTFGGVDYDARMLITEGNKPSKELQVLRSGSWVVERPDSESGNDTTYSNLSSGTSFVVSQDSNSAYRLLSIFRQPPLGAGFDVHRERTGEIDTILGERCEIWRSRLGPNVRPAPVYTDCITSDGVDLEAKVGSQSGFNFRTARAFNVVRRSVASREVEPPHNLLDWREWQTEPLPQFEKQRSFEVRLESIVPNDGAKPKQMLIRQMGQSRYSEDRTQGGDLAIDVQTPTRRLSYREDASGRPYRMTITPIGPASDRSKSLDSNEHVAGEKCQWFDVTPGMMDANDSECRTSDGIPIIIRNTSRGSVETNLKAVFIQRGETVPTTLAPPGIIFAWDRWLSPHLPPRNE